VEVRLTIRRMATGDVRSDYRKNPRHVQVVQGSAVKGRKARERKVAKKGIMVGRRYKTKT